VAKRVALTPNYFSFYQMEMTFATYKPID